MSLVQHASTLPARAEPRRSRHLTAVSRPERRRRPRLAYAVIALTGAAFIGAAQIGLTIATTQDAFTVAKLTQQNNQLTWQAQAAAQDLDGVSSPQVLATRAAELGLVVGGSANYLRLSNASVIGAAGPAAESSTVNPNGANSVPNALVRDTPPAMPASQRGAGVEPKTKNKTQIPPAAPAQPAAPPPADGLPTPTTR